MGTVPGDRPQTMKVYYLNAPFINLFRLAFPTVAGIPGNRIMLEDQGKYNRDSLYCYYLLAPTTSRDSALGIMRADLVQKTGLYPTIATKYIYCLIIKVKDGNRLPLGKEGDIRDLNITEQGHAAKFLHGYPLSALVEQLNRVQDVPVLDESGVEAGLNLSLPPDLTDITALRKALEKQGVALERQKRKLSFVHITPLSPTTYSKQL